MYDIRQVYQPKDLGEALSLLADIRMPLLSPAERMF